jgi:hypothetical protein
MRRVTHRQRALWALSGLIVALAVTLSILTAHVVRVNADPYRGWPACTHAIADAGGICHGEPR